MSSPSASPLLEMLLDVHLDRGSVYGEDVASAMRYECLSDLLPSTDGLAVTEPLSNRHGLTHKALREFVISGFDLGQFGIPYGERCGIMVPNGPELVVCLLACMNGWCAAPINPNSTAHEIESDISSVKAKVIIVKEGENYDAALVAAEKLTLTVLLLRPHPHICGIFSLEQLLGDFHEPSSKVFNTLTDTVLVLHTSGTSGNKKLVPYSLQNLCVGVGCIVLSWNLKPNDVNLNMMPLFHIGGIVRNLCAPILAGGTTISCSGFDAVLFWEVLEDSTPEQRFTWYYAAPTMHMAILHEASRRRQEGKSVSASRNVRMIANAAGGLLPILAEQLLDLFGATILPSYGMTECMPISSPPHDYKLDKAGSSGVPVGPHVRIYNDDGQQLETGETGEICLKGPPCFSGYEDCTEANAEAFLEGGWFKTGDVGYLDADNYLYITGRSKEIINRGGETISPLEIEQVFVQHPAVMKVIAFSAPHVTLQETVGLLVVIHENKQRPDLISLCNYAEGKLHPSKWPQVLVFTNELPLTVTNKPQRIKLANRLGLREVQDHQPQFHRMFEADCPPKGSSLSLPIVCRPIDVDIEVVRKCLELREFGVRKAVVTPMNLGQDDTNVVFVIPGTANVEGLYKMAKESLPDYLQPACILAVESIPAVNASVYRPSSSYTGVYAMELSYRSGEEIIVTCKEEDRWYGRTKTSKGWFVPDQNNARAQMAIKLEIPDAEYMRTLATIHINQRDFVSPADDFEATMERLWCSSLGVPRMSATAHFFQNGGDSLKAGRLVSVIRKEMDVWLTVAELFGNPTIRSLCTLLRSRISNTPRGSSRLKHLKTEPGTQLYQTSLNSDESLKSPSPFHQSSWPCLIIQSAPLVIFAPLRRLTLWFTYVTIWVALMNSGFDRFLGLVVSLLISRIVFDVLAPFVAIACKWLIVGRFQPGRYPLWGHWYLRIWIVDQLLIILTKGIFGADLPIIGSRLHNVYYRLLGAKIGKNVKIDTLARLGCADLLDIGDNVCIDQASLRPLALEAGHFVLLPIRIGENSSICCKSSIAAGAELPPNTHIGPQSSSHEMHDARLENRDFCRQAFPSPSMLLVIFIGIPILLVVFVITRLPWFFVLHLLYTTAVTNSWYIDKVDTVFEALMWWTEPQRMGFYILSRISRDVFAPFLSLLCAIIIKHTIIGKFKEGPRTGTWDVFRYWLMSKLIPNGTFCSVSSIIGTHYEPISWICRALGAKIGKRVYWPGSGIEGIVAWDLFEVGNDVTFGSRSVIMTADTKTLKSVTLKDGCMLADRSVLLQGVTLERHALLGSGSLGPRNHTFPIGSTWVGSTAGSAVMLAGADRKAASKSTLTAFGKAMYFRQADYFVIPLWVVTIINITCSCLAVVTRCAPILSSLTFADIFYHIHAYYGWHPVFKRAHVIYVVVVFAAIFAHLLVSLIVLEYDVWIQLMTLGRRKPGEYAWDKSSYCQRWQLYLALQQRHFMGDKFARAGVLNVLQGSYYLVWYFRNKGCKIGDNVCLYPFGADPMMTEPDLVTIGDHTSIDDASIIAHINTRGIFQLNPLVIGNSCVVRQCSRLVSGAVLKDGCMILEHTLILNGEEVEEGSVSQGWPLQSVSHIQDYYATTNKLLQKAKRASVDEEHRPLLN